MYIVTFVGLGDTMEEIVKQGLLYDFYGELLTEHQKEVYEAYVFENLSISEIASLNGISRQGASDLIKRINKLLLAYEDKLKLVDRFTRIREKIENNNNLSSAEKQDLLEEL